jgi:hypothetical protein
MTEFYHADAEKQTALSLSGSKWIEMWVQLGKGKISVGQVTDLISIELPIENIHFYSFGGLMAMWDVNLNETCCEVSIEPIFF